MSNTSVQVDLADPADVQSKLPQIKQLLDQQRKLRAELDAQIELLARIVGESPGATDAASRGRQRARGAASSTRSHGSPAQDRAVAALERAGAPMGPKALYDYMVDQGLDTPPNANALGANLWAAEKAGRIKKSGGRYVPLSYPITDYDYAGQQGFPVPDHLPANDEDTVP